jgi:hypothetical protein
MREVDDLTAAVERAREKLLGSVAGFSDAQAAFRPGEGQWSVLEVLEHLYLAEMSGVAKIWGALEALQAGRGGAEARPNRGRSIEEVVAVTWKPKEAAPEIATPHIGGPLRFWLAAHRSLRPLLADLGAKLQGVDLEAVVFPHFLSGPLDARQRLEFLRFHIERHAGQIVRIRASDGFPA